MRYWQRGCTGCHRPDQQAGLINLDFADIQTVMRDKGVAHIGIGRASGDNKAVDAIKSAMDSPLLETTVSGASDIIVNFRKYWYCGSIRCNHIPDRSRW